MKSLAECYECDTTSVSLRAFLTVCRSHNEHKLQVKVKSGVKSNLTVDIVSSAIRRKKLSPVGIMSRFHFVLCK